MTRSFDTGWRFGAGMPDRSNRSGSDPRSSPSNKFPKSATTSTRAESDRRDRDASTNVVAAEGQMDIDALRRSSARSSRISGGIELAPLYEGGGLGVEEAYHNPIWATESRQASVEFTHDTTEYGEGGDFDEYSEYSNPLHGGGAPPTGVNRVRAATRTMSQDVI